MINEDYKNDNVKTSHYAYLYYYKDAPVCYVSNKGLIRHPTSMDYYKNEKNILSDCGFCIHANRELIKRNFRNRLLGLNISDKNLSSLKGCPEIIEDFFDCSRNQLTTLKYGPKEVSGVYNCAYNKLTSLEGCPEKVYSFFCSNNRLTSLEYAPKKIAEALDCPNNKISKEELLRYLKTAKIGGKISTDYGYFKNQEEAIEKLSGQMAESYFDY